MASWIGDTSADYHFMSSMDAKKFRVENGPKLTMNTANGSVTSIGIAHLSLKGLEGIKYLWTCFSQHSKCVVN